MSRAADRGGGGQLGQFALGPTLLRAPGGGPCYINKKIEILLAIRKVINTVINAEMTPKFNLRGLILKIFQ